MHASRTPRQNLSPIEQRTLKNLKRKEFTYLPSDKGGEFCVIETSRYNELALEHLSDATVYKVISHIAPVTIEKRVNTVWTEICRQNGISKRVRMSYIASNSNIPRFYHLVKTHKTGPVLKIRPIISNTNGPTHKISWMLAKFLKPLLSRVPSHLESSLQLIQRIQQRDQATKERFTHPCSLDVVALYTSIPPQDAIRNIENMILQHDYEYPPLSTSDIIGLLKVVLENTYFCFNGRLFQQISGLAMGSSVSAILAILFMSTIETQALHSLSGRLDCYSRYVDDIFLLAESRESADEIYGIMNSIHPNIKFEIEQPSENNALSLLDFTVKVDAAGSTTFDFYKKTARSDVFMNGLTALPTSTKTNTIINEKRRIIERCTSETDAFHHLQQFHAVLVRNDHNTHGMNLQPPPKKRKNKLIGKETFFIHLPFISDEIDRGIRRAFKKAKLPVIPYYRNRTLRRILTNSKPHEPCNLRECPLNDPSLCTRKGVVYSILCRTCSSVYIGSTIRPLHQRVKEHIRGVQSAVHQHLLDCSNGNIMVEVLAHDTDPKNLRIKEAILISERNPSINRKEEEVNLLENFTYFSSS
jgi:hypothetical protein